MTDTTAVAKTITPKFDVFANVAVPAVKRVNHLPTGPRGSIYPVDQLPVGGAFFVPAAANATDEDLTKLVKTVQSSVSRLAKQLKIKLALRKLVKSEDAAVNPWGEPGVGIFRLEGEYVYKPRPKKTKAAA